MDSIYGEIFREKKESQIAYSRYNAALEALSEQWSDTGLEVYLVGSSAVYTLGELNRLRNEAYRPYGVSFELDECDRGKFLQLVCLDRRRRKIQGSYRVGFLSDLLGADPPPIGSTSDYFIYSERFVEEVMPHSLEIGRLFVASDSRYSGLVLYSLIKGLLLLGQQGQIRYFVSRLRFYPAVLSSAMLDLIDYVLFYYWDYRSPNHCHSEDSERRFAGLAGPRPEYKYWRKKNFEELEGLGGVGLLPLRRIEDWPDTVRILKQKFYNLEGSLKSISLLLKYIEFGQNPFLVHSFGCAFSESWLDCMVLFEITESVPYRQIRAEITRGKP